MTLVRLQNAGRLGLPLPYCPSFSRHGALLTTFARRIGPIQPWMIRDCIDWHHDGLQSPCSVRAATDEYRTEKDVLGRFMRLGGTCERVCSVCKRR
jgi:hypothetical protein